jgi:hypothetical protein
MKFQLYREPGTGECRRRLDGLLPGLSVRSGGIRKRGRMDCGGR